MLIDLHTLRNHPSVWNDAELRQLAGGKAWSLLALIRRGLHVPGGFILDSRTFEEELEAGGELQRIRALLTGLTRESAADISRQIMEILRPFRPSAQLESEIAKRLEPGRRYAVRSSATLEDMSEASFAGQYESELRLEGIESVMQGILVCWRSLYSPRSLAYLASKPALKNRLDSLRMAVIVQQMVEARASGVVFTAHPLTGEDTLMLAELSTGTAEHLVSGRVKPLSLTMPWFGQVDVSQDIVQKLDLQAGQLTELRDRSLEIAALLGEPADIEFAFGENGELSILQARPITGMRYEGYEQQWTTADFKDGGVSAAVCRHYMWSLYEEAWELALGRFLSEGRLIDPPPAGPYSRLIFGRPYWNLDIVRQAMTKVPGYKERAFDEDYGIQGHYEGDGRTTPASPGNLLRFLPIAGAQMKLLKQREAEAPGLKADLLDEWKVWQERLNELEARLRTAAVPDEALWSEISSAWEAVQFEAYLRSETSYFWQIFLNTIHQTRIRDSLLKDLSEADYLALMGGLDQISHLVPYYRLWELSREILADDKLAAFWQQPVSELLSVWQSKPQHPAFRGLADWLAVYGYHSEKELDVSWPNFSEAPDTVIRQLQETLRWGEEMSPERSRRRQHAAFEAKLAELHTRFGRPKTARMERKIRRIRELLWWREEFRDISTRYYALVRRSALLLANTLVKRGILEQTADIWNLKIGEIRSYLHGELTDQALHDILRQNSLYYEAHRRCPGPNEIPPGSHRPAATGQGDSPEGEAVLARGITANGGSIRGRARVIRGLGEIDRLEAGDILVTRFTDTGWTAKFAVISGLVTEYGGVLSHAAIVSREYGIPCLVGAADAMEAIEDGRMIRLDASRGIVLDIEGES